MNATTTPSLKELAIAWRILSALSQDERDFLRRVRPEAQSTWTDDDRAILARLERDGVVRKEIWT